MKAVFSFIMAVFTALSSFGPEMSFATVEELFTDAISLAVQRIGFLDEIGDDDIGFVDESAGYVKNTVLIFFDEDAGFFSRLDALRESGGITVGSMPDMELCVVQTAPTDLDGLMAMCDKLNSHGAVAMAAISPAHRLENQYTPDDPFTDYDWYEEHGNESSPGDIPCIPVRRCGTLRYGIPFESRLEASVLGKHRRRKCHRQGRTGLYPHQARRKRTGKGQYNRPRHVLGIFRDNYVK